MQHSNRILDRPISKVRYDNVYGGVHSKSNL